MIVRVLLPLPFPHAFDYRVPSSMSISMGDYVKVPFGKKELIGVAWEPLSNDPPHPKTKEILEKILLPPFPGVSREFLEWVASYTLTPRGLVLKMSMSVPQAFEPRKKKKTETPLSPRLEPVELSLSQSQAVQAIRNTMHASRPYLLDGVTGSGKTEVYFEIIQNLIDKGLQSLVLLPEISLSSQWLERFQERFGVPPILWHSSLTPAQRRRNWLSIAQGEAKVIVGARSALFLPYPKLGLIVVDEEHDGSYKQEESVIYNARDMAVVRGNLGKIPVILASATPSLESLENCKTGKYTHLFLSSRYGGARFPEIKLIDMRAYSDKQARLARKSQWLSPPLVTLLNETFNKKEQALLFLNRRGYAPLSLCGCCGERVACPYCTSWLVEHRFKGHLICHHCGHSIKPVKNCEACGKEDSIVACGPGVERIAEDLAKLLPACRHRIVTSDVIHTPKMLQEIIAQFQNHELDALIGTQMLAKGFHFPNLTLVGVIDADLGLAGADLRASEKTYQLLHQVSGRAGREHKPGKVLLQTYQPHHPLYAALQSNDREQFLDQEKLSRERSGMPPFGKLAALIISGAHPADIESALKAISSKLPRLSDVDIWGPSPAPLSLLRGKQRWRYLLKAPKNVKVQSIIQDWLKTIVLPRTVKVQVDIDPYSFL